MAIDPGSPWDARAERELANIVTRPNPPNKRRFCSVCKQPQFETPSGICCVNGHGGAPSTAEEATYAVGLQAHMNTANVVALLLELSPHDRMSIFNQFCTHCGDANPKCQCWNDD
jgi:hypothetical protein